MLNRRSPIFCVWRGRTRIQRLVNAASNEAKLLFLIFFSILGGLIDNEARPLLMDSMINVWSSLSRHPAGKVQVLAPLLLPWYARRCRRAAVELLLRSSFLFLFYDFSLFFFKSQFVPGNLGMKTS